MFILIDFIGPDGSTETNQKTDPQSHFFDLLESLMISGAGRGEELTTSSALNQLHKHLFGYLNSSPLLVGASPAPLHIVRRR